MAYLSPGLPAGAIRFEEETVLDEYLTPYEAAEQLERLSHDLSDCGADAEDLEELREIARRFYRHLNGRETLHDVLKEASERILC